MQVNAPLLMGVHACISVAIEKCRATICATESPAIHSG